MVQPYQWVEQEQARFDPLDGLYEPFLILCGMDTQRKVGHLPGQSLLALGKNGIGDRSRIVGAKGKRPVSE